MQELFGTYRGFTPTDESAVGTGEIQIVIDAEGLTMSIATGLEIQEDMTPMSEIRALTDEEINFEMEEGAILPAGTHGLLLIESGIKLIFVTTDDDSGGVFVLGMMSDEIFGPTFAFTPSQVDVGMFEKAVRMMEEHYGTIGATPRLSHDGKAPNSVATDAVST